MQPSVRAEIVTRRTYNRPINDNETIFETWEDTIDRVIDHQRWLWERALTHKILRDMPLHDITEDMSEWVRLDDKEWMELEYLREIMLERKALPSGRTLWLGGTDVSKHREASQFNCAHTDVETVYDVVDIFWLLLQGCGVGFTPKKGILTGFRKPIPNIKVIHSERTEKGGRESNEEHFRDGVWTISVGDSAESWAKSIGKLLAGKYKAHTLVFDFSEIRPEGERLKGYGWISSGDGPISRAYPAIAGILNKRAGAILTKLDLVDIVNWLGTVLSSRRSAEIALVEYGSDEWREFAKMKENCYMDGWKHRQQSNNSLVFYNKPTRTQLSEVFDMIIKHGGSEPGFINGETARKRAPWFSGVNPSLRKGTLVYTTKGIKPIEDLEAKEFSVFTLEKEIAEARCQLSGKNKILYKIELVGGHSYFATAEHNWPVSRKGYNVGRDFWSPYFKVCTTDILPGDCLPIIKRDCLFADGIKGTYEEGRFLGWLQGDGWITIRGDNGKAQVGLIVSKKEEEMIPLLLNVLRPFSKANFIDRGSTLEFNTQNQALYKYITELGYIDKENIPTSLYSSEYTEEFRAGYIDGIFSSDGCVSKTSSGGKLQISISSSRQQFIEQLSEYLGFYGINSVIHNRKPTKCNLNNKYYTSSSLKINKYDCIKHFSNIFNLSVEHKQDKLLELKVPKRKMLEDKIQVLSVSKTNLIEDVWDISVDAEDHTFQIGHCITGNCGEILLPNKGFCNLVEIAISKFKDNMARLFEVVPLIARANYRQTCVDFRDGVLQESWHLNNEFLRLCGVSITGTAQRDDISEYDLKCLNRVATQAAGDMAKELGTQRPKNTTTGKPSGTLSKIMGDEESEVWEGIHKPLGRYIFNWVNYSQKDPLVDKMKKASYNWILHPSEPEGILFCSPVDNGNYFDKVEVTRKDGSIEVLEINKETAIDQLERYKKIQLYYCDQNVSNTISYDIHEKDDIIDWILENWDIYVGVSFLFRNDPTLSAKDLGFEYLPQEVVTKDAYDEYAKSLGELDFSDTDTFEEIGSQEDCVGGICPVK